MSTGHRLGFAVKLIGDGGLPSHDARRWQSEPHLRVSLEHLDAILTRLDELDIRMYRMATQLAPYATHPDLPQFHNQVEECAPELAALGARARGLDIRLSTHPGQYTVLNSEDEAIRRSAAAELEVQAALMDAMGLPGESVVVLHVGGSAGGKAAGAERFERGLELLSDAARARLVIENDDRTYAVREVCELAGRTGLRVVWDSLHHRCNDPELIPESEALDMALATWPGDCIPKIHVSSPRLDVEERKKKVGRRVERSIVMPQLRAHADLVDPIAFETFIRGPLAGRRCDVMIEAKAKDLAVGRLRDQLADRGFGWEAGRLVEPEPAGSR
ncbi:UV DNA damage repair endonuclease UvsE [Thermoleophilia bacterium SCSIO 60948]|nr:UV DNA damage repair endonuclease UvsE [Thermoleophilia bacterium SCSIO 60948]